MEGHEIFLRDALPARFVRVRLMAQRELEHLRILEGVKKFVFEFGQ
jgi:hypothetical protein